MGCCRGGNCHDVHDRTTDSRPAAAAAGPGLSAAQPGRLDGTGCSDSFVWRSWLSRLHCTSRPGKTDHPGPSGAQNCHVRAASAGTAQPIFTTVVQRVGQHHRVRGTNRLNPAGQCADDTDQGQRHLDGAADLPDDSELEAHPDRGGTVSRCGGGDAYAVQALVPSDQKQPGGYRQTGLCG